MLKNKKGFTLIELIIVVAIMAVLVALLAPNVLKYLEKSKVAKDIAALDAVRLAIEAELVDEEIYNLNTNQYNAGNAKVQGIIFHTFCNATGTDAGFKKLYDKIFEENLPVLDDSFITTDNSDDHLLAFDSRTAKNNHALIAVYLNGEGGIAVAAINGYDGTIISYEGKEMVVFSKLSREDLDDIITDF